MNKVVVFLALMLFILLEGRNTGTNMNTNEHSYHGQKLKISVVTEIMGEECHFLVQW